MVTRNNTVSHKKYPFFPPRIDSEPMHFYSKNDLLNVSLHHHIEYLKSFLDDKTNFMTIFKRDFIQNSHLNCQSFESRYHKIFYEPKFQYKFPEVSISNLKGLRITAVDGGVGIQEYLGLTLTVIKVGVVNYYFDFNSDPEINIFPPPQRDENYAFFSDVGDLTEDKPRKLANLRRILAENSLLLQFLQTTITPPDLVILDGSLLPPPKSASLSDHSNHHDLYQSCITSYLDLYSFCEENGILLIGSVKDTKSTVLRDLLLRAFPSFLGQLEGIESFYHCNYREMLKHYLDSDLVFNAVDPRHRSLLFQYTFGLDMDLLYPESIRNFFKESPVIASYCQISPYDLPLRIEMLKPEHDQTILSRFLKILHLILPLSQITLECSLPLPQIEAHLQAHIREEEMALVSQMFENQYRIFHFQDQNKTNLINSAQNQNSTNKNEKLYAEMKGWFGTFYKTRHERLDRIF